MTAPRAKAALFCFATRGFNFAEYSGKPNPLEKERICKV